MPILNGNVTDQNKVPVVGALVYVYNVDGQLAELTDHLNQALDNPVTTGEDGYWEAYAEEAYYTAHYYWGGRRRYIEANIVAGRSTLEILADLRDEAQLAATAAQGFSNYRATRAEGVSDFAVGEFFSSAETGELRLYQRIAGSPFYQDQGDTAAPVARVYAGTLTSADADGIRQRLLHTSLSGAQFNFAVGHFPAQSSAGDNSTVAIGWDLLGGGGTSGRNAVGWVIERNYTLAGRVDPAAEVQLRSFNTAGAGKRMFNAYIPYSPTSTESQLSFQTDNQIWYKWDGTEALNWDVRTGQMFFGSNILLSNSNNVAIFRQYNAAGDAHLTLPYIDADDNLRISQPVIGSVTAQESAAIFASGEKYAIGVRVTGLTADDYLDYMDTADTNAFEVIGISRKATATDSIKGELVAKAAGKAWWDLTGTDAATGYYVNGTKVVGAQQAAIADPAYAAAAPTKAEFDALVDTVRAMLASDRTHGQIAT